MAADEKPIGYWLKRCHDLLDHYIDTERLLAIHGSFFAIMALTLVAVGVYGLFTHLMTKRVAEIGIRIALVRARSR
jgi:hypothetical protein